VEGWRPAGETRLRWSRTVSRMMSCPWEHCSKLSRPRACWWNQIRKSRTMSYGNINNIQKYQQRDVAINQRFVLNPMNWNHEPERCRCNLQAWTNNRMSSHPKMLEKHVNESHHHSPCCWHPTPCPHHDGHCLHSCSCLCCLQTPQKLRLPDSLQSSLCSPFVPLQSQTAAPHSASGGESVMMQQRCGSLSIFHDTGRQNDQQAHNVDHPRFASSCFWMWRENTSSWSIQQTMDVQEAANMF